MWRARAVCGRAGPIDADALAVSGDVVVSAGLNGGQVFAAGVGGNGNGAGGGGVDGVEHGWSERPGEWRDDGRVVHGLRGDALKRR